MQSQATPSSLASRNRGRAIFYGGVATVMLVVVLASLLAVLHLRQLTISSAYTSSQGLARSVALTISGLLDAIDIALLASSDEIGRQISAGKTDAASITHTLEQQRNRLTRVAYLRATNEQGAMVYGPGIPSPPANLADRDYFLKLRADPGAGLVIVEPVVGRVSQKWVWTFARRVNKPDGSFGGIVYAAIEVEELQKLFAQVYSERGGSIGLRDASLRLIARHTFDTPNPMKIGDQQLSTPFREALTASPQEGSFLSDASGPDETARLNSYVRSQKYGFVVVAGVTRQVALEGWQGQAWVIGCLVALFIVMGLAYSWSIGREWHRQDLYVTALEENRQALQENEERWKFALEGSGDGVFDRDLVTGRVKCSRRYWEMYGLNEREYQDTAYDGFARVHPDDLPRLLAARQEHFDHRTPSYQCEHRMRCEDGSWKWVLSRGMVVSRDAHGKPLRLVGTNTDITERKRAEQALRESEQRFSTVFFSNPIGISITRMSDGKMLEVNDAALRLYERSREELIGRTGDERGSFVDPGERAMLRAALKERGEVDGMEIRLRQRSGAVRTVAVSARPVTIGEEACVINMLVDVSEQKRLEQVHLQAQKLESLGTLAGGIAHDFNNILAAIRGNADLAAEDAGADSPLTESLAEIQKAGARATELIRRITTFGRPKEPHQESVDLAPVVQEVLKLLRSTLPAGITLQPRFGQGVPPVLADSSQVHEAIINLTTNAAHAIGPRAGLIEYLLEAADLGRADAEALNLPPGRYARLTVKDNGSGMDEATKARIFDAFFTTKSVGEGTGLGLSMVHGIMKSHGGSVAVDSTPGKGSSFHLYFPAATGTGAKTPPAEPSSAGAVLSAGKRVLYVDDEEALVFLAERVLGRLGHGVTGFTDPGKALQEFRGHPGSYDIVVTDLSMPKMSGYDVAREVLAIRPGIPVIMTTGYVRAEDEASASQAGIRELILKPVAVNQLATVLDRIFRDSNPDAKAQT